MISSFIFFSIKRGYKPIFYSSANSYKYIINGGKLQSQAGYPQFVDNYVHKYCGLEKEPLLQTDEIKISTIYFRRKSAFQQEIVEMIGTYPQVMHNLWISVKGELLKL